MKKLTYKIIAFMLLLLLLCSCSNGNEGKPSEPEKETGIDLFGSELLVIADIDPSSEVFLTYNTNTVFADAAIKRLSDTEKKLNCVITELKTAKEFDVALRSDSAVGLPSFDFTVQAKVYSVLSLMKEELLFPVNTLDSLDYTDSEKWGNANQLEAFMYNNSLYGVIPALWPENTYLSQGSVLLCNNDMLALAGASPKEYLENKTWTLDSLQEFTIALDHNDDEGNHVYGNALDRRHLLEMVWKAYGIDVACKDGNGGWTSDLFNQIGLTATQSAFDYLYGDYGYCVMPGGTKKASEAFVDRTTSMCMMYCDKAFDRTSVFLYGDIPFTVMPFPVADGYREQGDWPSQYERENNAIMLSAFSSQPDACGYVINELFAPFEDYETVAEMKAYYNDSIFFDPDDCSIVLAMAKKGRYIFHDELADDVHTKMAADGQTKTAFQVLEDYKDQYLQRIEEYITPVYSSKEALFPSAE